MQVALLYMKRFIKTLYANSWDLCFVSTGWITHLFTGDVCV